MNPDAVANALTVDIPLEPVDDTEVRAGWVQLGTIAGGEIGVWEITPGVVTDTEAEELFVVLKGAAVVEFLDGGDPLTLGEGTVGRFIAGTRTRWTVTETLRKVYVTA